MTELLPNRPVPEPVHRHGSDPEASGNPLRLAILSGLVVLAGLVGGWPLLVMIAALVIMIFLHELGHYLTAKWAGMKVTEFFIGFGPRIWAFQRGETEYGVKALPLGAYVKIIGMHNLDEFDQADADRTYMSKPFWRRLSVAVAGSTMHFLLALVCFFAAFALVGLPGGALPFTQADADALRAEDGWVVGAVTPNSAARDAGIQVGDQILTIDGIDVSTFDEFSEVVVERPDELVPVVVERDGETLSLQAEIGTRDDAPEQGFFGVGYDLPNRTVGVVDAVEETGSAFVESIGETFGGLTHILSPTGLSELGRAAFTSDDGSDGDDAAAQGSGSSSSGEPQAAGIIRISDIGAGLLDDGEFGYWLAVFATVNIFIGIFNLLPLLPLDGGHVAIAIYEKIRSMFQGGRPYHIDVVKLLPITYAAVLVLAFLGVSTIVLDTRSLVGG